MPTKEEWLAKAKARWPDYKVTDPKLTEQQRQSTTEWMLLKRIGAPCCKREKRNMNGACTNCGDPPF